MSGHQAVLKSYLNAQDEAGHKLCILCRRGQNSDFIYGPFFIHKHLAAHANCLLFAAGLCQRGADHNSMNGFLEEDILIEAKRGARLNCSHCRQPGATVGCFAPTCRKSFHFPCGIESKMFNEYYGEYRSFCNRHMPKQEIPSNYVVPKSTCMICQTIIENIPCFEALWAPCCKNTWFHRSCLQKLATNAGHHFRCPVCSNNSVFCSEMRQNGIFVLEENPAWDVEQAARIHELEVRNKRCYQEKCLCPQGRDYSAKQTRWELKFCSSCGLKGVHVGCGNLNLLLKWECENCTPKPPSTENSQLPEEDKCFFKRSGRKILSGPIDLSSTSSEDSDGDDNTTAKKKKRSAEIGKQNDLAVSRNVAKKSRHEPFRSFIDVRFVVLEEQDETWVFYGEKDDDLPYGEPLSVAMKQRALLKGYRIRVDQERNGKTIWVWCGKPWDRYKNSVASS